ncbi:alpha/beta fold hydrolase [Microbacterium sp. RD1]|uniref:alpha/beta fold hydrolase n=1 Tax=Microbacterium sp. RD1 TaxID=3457313 RepID=UPI003FA60255
MSESPTQGEGATRNFTPSGSLTLPTGRVLAWDEYGDPNGPAVFHFHGSPANRLLAQSVVDAAERVGVRLISPDRPGCGDSTFDAERTVRSWPADVMAIADFLDIAEFAVIGGSGGGPYALACAALIPDRIVEAYVVCGVGPLDTAEKRAAMNPINRDMFEVASGGPAAAIPLVEAMVGKSAAHGEDAGILGKLMSLTPPADAAAMQSDPTLIDWMARVFALANQREADGPAYDLWLFTQPWELDLASIDIPVKFHAGAHDINVPFAHVQHQHESIPGSTLRIWPDDGHVIGAIRVPDILEEIAQRARGGATGHDMTSRGLS